VTPNAQAFALILCILGLLPWVAFMLLFGLRSVLRRLIAWSSQWI